MNNYSKQREIVLDVFKELSHPTAEIIYNKVHQVDSTISKSTVYRNINVLLDSNIIRKIKVLNGPDKYDYNSKKHYHIICEKCGKAYDFIYHFNQNELARIIENQTGVIANIDSTTMYGICEKCKIIEKEVEKNGKL